MSEETAPQPEEAPADIESSPEDVQSPAKGGQSRLRAILFMLIGIAAGIGCAFIVPGYYSTYALSPELQKKAEAQQGMNDADRVLVEAGLAKIEKQNSALTLGIYGGILGAAFGLLASLLHRPSRFLLGLIGGAVFGAAGGTAAGFAAAIAYQYARASGIQFTGAVAHSVAWSILGIGLGLTFACAAGGLRSLPGYLFAGVLAGFLGALVFHPGVAILLPVHNVDIIMPIEFAPQVAWTAVPAAMFGLFLGGRQTA